MKITLDHVTPSQKQIKPYSVVKNNSTSDNFNTVLNKELGSKINSEEKIQSRPEISSTKLVQLKNHGIIDRQTLILRLERLMDKIEEYSFQFNDPHAQIQHIQPLVRSIKNEMEKLTPQLELLPDGDELKEIVKQTLQATALEMENYTNNGYFTGTL